MDPTVGEALSRHPDVDMMSFTGSTRAGSLVAQNAAPTVKRVTQELGGKSPNIILEDADLEAAVTRGVLHMYNNTGQSCNAPSRMLVPRALLSGSRGYRCKGHRESVVSWCYRLMTRRRWGRLSPRCSGTKYKALIEAGVAEGRQGGLRWPRSCLMVLSVATT